MPSAARQPGQRFADARHSSELATVIRRQYDVRVTRLVFGLAAIFTGGGCAKGTPGTPAESSAADVSGSPSAASEPTHSSPARADARETGDVADAEPPVEPLEEPPAPPPTLSDGTLVEPCATPLPEGMQCIAGGAFIRGTDDGATNTQPAATVELQTFYMDTYEVTFAEYKACQKAKACPRSGPRYTDFDHPKMPIQGVSWFDAVAYCEANGKSLPTEAQWEKAARGPDGALHPWGDAPATCERAIIKDETGRSCGLKKAISKPDTGRPWDVGSRPAGVYGLHDMAGNSWEWVADWYGKSYGQCGDACVGIDPKGPCDGAEQCPGHWLKIVRGGSWYWEAERATSVWRRTHKPSNDPFHHFGFRCAASVAQAAAMGQ